MRTARRDENGTSTYSATRRTPSTRSQRDDDGGAAAAILRDLSPAMQPDETERQRLSEEVPVKVKALDQARKARRSPWFTATSDAQQDRIRALFMLNQIVLCVCLHFAKTGSREVSALLIGLKVSAAVATMVQEEARLRRQQGLPSVARSIEASVLSTCPDGELTYGNPEHPLLLLHGVAQSQNWRGHAALNNAQRTVRSTLAKYFCITCDKTTLERIRTAQRRILREILDPNHARQHDQRQMYFSEYLAAITMHKADNRLFRAVLGSMVFIRHVGQKLLDFIQELRGCH